MFLPILFLSLGVIFAYLSSAHKKANIGRNIDSMNNRQDAYADFMSTIGDFGDYELSSVVRGNGGIVTIFKDARTVLRFLKAIGVDRTNPDEYRINRQRAWTIYVCFCIYPAVRSLSNRLPALARSCLRTAVEQSFMMGLSVTTLTSEYRSEVADVLAENLSSVIPLDDNEASRPQLKT